MSEKIFWTEKRLEAISKLSLTLFQALIIAGFLGGAFDKLSLIWLKIFFIFGTFVLLILGIFLADVTSKKE